MWYHIFRKGKENPKHQKGKFMENAKTMREIALVAMREKVTRELALASELIEKAICKIIKEAASNGHMETMVHIPAGYNISLVIQILEESDYKVCETQKYRDYLIKW
jgi:hypothetical protein